jgi:hypothetical protein
MDVAGSPWGEAASRPESRRPDLFDLDFLLMLPFYGRPSGGGEWRMAADLVLCLFLNPRGPVAGATCIAEFLQKS